MTNLNVNNKQLNQVHHQPQLKMWYKSMQKFNNDLFLSEKQYL